MRLYLIRHGQTPANIAGELDTAPPGAELTPWGERQAEGLAAALGHQRLAAVHASPAARAVQTAGPLAARHGMEVTVTAGLQEIAAGDLEMRSDRAAVEEYLGCIAAWVLGDRGRRMPGGETGHGFATRYADAVRRIGSGRGPDETAVAVSHGAAIRTFTALAVSDVDVEAIAHRRVVNTGGILLEGDGDAGWRLARWWSEPLGGQDLLDPTAHDVTGETVEDALAD